MSNDNNKNTKNNINYLLECEWKWFMSRGYNNATYYITHSKQNEQYLLYSKCVGNM